MSIKWLQTTTTNESLSYLQKFQIIIDGYEYTAVQDRRYSFETTSPSRIIQSGFDYSGHSVVQPATVSYTIIVSKYDRAELNRLLTWGKKNGYLADNPIDSMTISLRDSMS